MEVFMNQEFVNKYIKDAHENAKNHGFYDCPECEGRGEVGGITSTSPCGETFVCDDCNGTGKDPNKNIGELLMLIVSELGEALEAHRTNDFTDIAKFDFYLKNEFTDIDEKNYAFEEYVKDSFEDKIADVFIRLFDLCGYLDISDKALEIIAHQFNHPTKLWERDSNNIGSELFSIDSALHYFAKEYQNEEENNNGLTLVFRKAWNFCFFHKIQIQKHIEAKMAYNKTRPRLHGKEY